MRCVKNEIKNGIVRANYCEIYQTIKSYKYAIIDFQLCHKVKTIYSPIREFITDALFEDTLLGKRYDLR